MRLSHTALLVVLPVALSLAACQKKKGADGKEGPNGGEGGDGSEVGQIAVTVTAQLSSDGGTPLSTAALAVPITGGVADDQALGAATRGAVSAGTMSLEIPTTALHLEGDGTISDIVVATYDETAGDRFEQGMTFKFLTAKMDPSAADACLALPAPKVGSTIEFGNVPIDGSDEAVGDATIAAEDFGVSAEVITELAATDKALKTVKNAYMNTDKDAGIALRAALSYKYAIDPRPLLTDDRFSTGAETNYFGYNVEFSGFHPGLAPDVVCGTGVDGKTVNAARKALTLTPPTAVCATDRGVEPTTKGGDCDDTDSATHFGFSVLDNADATAAAENSGTTGCYSYDMQAAPARMHLFGFSQYPPVQAGELGKLYFGWGGGWGFLGALSPGYWDLKLGGELIGRFDLASSYPFRTEGAKEIPRFYVPRVKITTTGTAPDRVFSKMEIMFYLAEGLDANGDVVYREVKDFNAMRRVLKDGKIHLGAHDFGIDGVRDGVWAHAYPTLPETGNSVTITQADLVSEPGGLAASDPWYLCDIYRTNTSNTAFQCSAGLETTHKIAKNFGISYEMYGNQYMFSLEVTDN